MSNPNFTPPPQKIEIAEMGSYPDGRVNMLTALILDAAGQEFSLTLVTAARLASDSLEEPEETPQLLDPGWEPVFIVPGAEIEPAELDTIIEGITPELLSRYLVKQED